jgi:hypothetical protein
MFVRFPTGCPLSRRHLDRIERTKQINRRTLWVSFQPAVVIACWMMTGIRSRSGCTTSFGSVVMTVNVSSSSPAFRSLRFSHSEPAKKAGPRSFQWRKAALSSHPTSASRKRIRGKQTTAIIDRLPGCSRCRDRLCFRIDRADTDARLFRPEGMLLANSRRSS